MIVLIFLDEFDNAPMQLWGNSFLPQELHDLEFQPL
jgi:hypothetical protein